MLKLAAFLLASAVAGAAAAATTATPSSALSSSSPWWEKVTVTVTGDGNAKSCRYETSLKPNAGESCSVEGSAGALAHSASASKDSYTRITFERRFSPEVTAAKTELQAGDTLLGGQVLALAIDARGAVKGCKIVATSGDMKPEYGCDEAAAERFQAGVATGAAAPREGYMTILVYGHSEHLV